MFNMCKSSRAPFLLCRAQEKAKLQADPNKTLGDVTTVNLTIINGGVQTNVVPDKYVGQATS